MRHPSHKKGDMVGKWKISGIEMRAHSASSESTEILYTLSKDGNTVMAVKEEILCQYEEQ